MATGLAEPANSGGPTDSGSGGQAGAPDSQAASRKGQPWTEDEHIAFLDGLKKLGRGQWRLISRHFVKTRTPTQVASHAQKHFIRLSGLTKRKSRFTALDQKSSLELLSNAAAAASGAAAAAAAATHGEGSVPAVPGHSSNSSDQQQRHQGSAGAPPPQEQQHAPSPQAAAAAAAAAQFPLAAMGPYGAALMQLGMHPAMMQQAMMFAALTGGIPFMPPFMCPPPALAAAAAMNAAAMQKQGASVLSLFPMSAFQGGMPAMWAQAAVALAQQQQQYMGLVQEAQEQEEAGGAAMDEDHDENEEVEQQVGDWQEAAAQPQHQALPRHHSHQQQHRPHQPQVAPPSPSPPGSPAQVCKPEATHARRSTPEEPSALLSMLPASASGADSQVAFHASSHSAFRPPQQEVRAES